MQEHRRDKPVPFAADKNTWPITGTEPNQGFSIHSPQNGKAATLSCLHRSHQFHGEQNHVYGDDAGRHGSAAAENPGQAFAHRGQRETQIRAALVTASRVNAYKSSAGWPRIRDSASRECLQAHRKPDTIAVAALRRQTSH